MLENHKPLLYFDEDLVSGLSMTPESLDREIGRGESKHISKLKWVSRTSELAGQVDIRSRFYLLGKPSNRFSMVFRGDPIGEVNLAFNASAQDIVAILSGDNIKVAKD